MFVASKLAWVRINDDLPQYAEWAPSQDKSPIHRIEAAAEGGKRHTALVPAFVGTNVGC